MKEIYIRKGGIMKKYDVCITEYLDEHIEIEAESPEEAHAKAQEMYDNEEIVLDYTNLTQMEIEVTEHAE